MAHFATFIASLLIVAAMAQDAPEEPEYCKSRAVPYTCLTPLFTKEIIEKIATLKDVNLVAISQTTDEADFNVKLDALDTFCGPFLNATRCGKTGIWWECSRDISAVTSLINAVQDTLNGAEARPEYYLPADKIQTYMRYAGLVCNETSGLRQVLRSRQCITDSFEKSSDHFKNIQLGRLSDILAGSSFTGKCHLAQNGIYDLMEVVDAGCPPETADSVFRFVSASFTIVPQYSVDTCPINRTRTEFDVETELTNVLTKTDAVTETEPSWCADKTSAAKYRCFAQNLKADLMAKLNLLNGLNPLLASTFSEANFTTSMQTVHSFCEFLNTTIGCADQWWKCSTDINSITRLINDLQDLVNGPGKEEWHLSPSYIQRYFVFADYLCATDDLDRLQANQACVRDALATVQDSNDRLTKILATKRKFNETTCANAKGDVKIVLDAVTAKCQSAVGEFTKTLLLKAFIMLDGYSERACQLLAATKK